MKEARDFSGGAQRAKKERKVGRRYRGAHYVMQEISNFLCTAAWRRTMCLLDVEQYGMTSVAQRSLRDRVSVIQNQMQTFTNCETLLFGP